jgi:GNAT superfamily N-acetyltransferase
MMAVASSVIPSSIRRARHDERPRIWEIRWAVRENRLDDPALVTEDDVAWFIDNPGIWVWDEGGRLLGFSAADPRDGTIWALFVDPAHEGRGIGRGLLEAACAVLRHTGHRTALLTTGRGTRAERFYRTAGWDLLGTSLKGELIFRSTL